MPQKIVAGNWKSNKNFSEAQALMNDLSKHASNIPNDVDVIIAPPALYIQNACQSVQGISVAAQNSSATNEGAFTGELTATMIKSVGAKYCIVGHSERRAMFGDTDQVLEQKVLRILEAGLTPIVCCGETLEERKSGREFEVVKAQLTSAAFQLSSEDFQKCIIAYEPVWAIGTGETATSEQAQDMHANIRSWIVEKYGQEIATETSILYGGSCKPSNAKELFACADVNGGLIGGASLNAEDFIAIAQSF